MRTEYRREVSVIAGADHVWCDGCGKWRRFDEFNKATARYLGIQSCCRECSHSRQERWRLRLSDAGHTQAADYARRYRYNCTPEQYKGMWERQDGCCAICNVKLGKHRGENGHVVDHCHSSNKVRGLLCKRCNAGLGQFLDNPVALRTAAEYVGQYSGSKPEQTFVNYYGVEINA